jgi:hypothetical protein
LSGRASRMAILPNTSNRIAQTAIGTGDAPVTGMPPDTGACDPTADGEVGAAEPDPVVVTDPGAAATVVVVAAAAVVVVAVVVVVAFTVVVVAAVVVVAPVVVVVAAVVVVVLPGGAAEAVQVSPDGVSVGLAMMVSCTVQYLSSCVADAAPSVQA